MSFDFSCSSLRAVGAETNTDYAEKIPFLATGSK